MLDKEIKIKKCDLSIKYLKIVEKIDGAIIGYTLSGWFEEYSGAWIVKCKLI